MPGKRARTLAADDTLDKLARSGALKLLKTNHYTASDFRRELLEEYGSSLKPYLDEIYARASRLKRQALVQARDERRNPLRSRARASAQRPRAGGLKRQELRYGNRLPGYAP